MNDALQAMLDEIDADTSVDEDSRDFNKRMAILFDKKASTIRDHSGIVDEMMEALVNISVRDTSIEHSLKTMLQVICVYTLARTIELEEDIQKLTRLIGEQ